MSDSESSNSDNFFDAEDQTPLSANPSLRRRKGQDETDNSLVNPDSLGAAAAMISPPASAVSPGIENQIEILTGDQLSSRDQRWSRLEGLRRKEEEERCCEGEDTNTPCDSTESSVEGIFISGVRSLHPFKVVEPDSRSTQSDVKSIARSSVSTGECEAKLMVSLPEDNLHQSILASALERAKSSAEEKEVEVVVQPHTATPVGAGSGSGNSGGGGGGSGGAGGDGDGGEDVFVRPAVPLLRPHPNLVPDIVSSTKTTAASSDVSPLPKVPPRRRKTTNQTSTPPSVSRESSVETEETVSGRPASLPVCSPPSPATPALPSPHTTVNSLTRDLEQSLLLSPSHPDYDLDKVSGLNISLACRGDYVVKPQDDEKTRGIAIADDYSDRICTRGESFDLGSASAGDQGATATSTSSTTTATTYFSQDPSGGAARLTSSPGDERGNSGRNRTGYMAGSGSGGHRSDGHHSGGSGGHHSGGSGGHHSGGSGGHHSGGSGGHHSGAARTVSGKGGSGGSDRRSNAGSVGSGGSDGGMIKQMGLYVRVKSDSGKKLTDQEILQQIKVKNLDTGTEMDLATAEEHLPESINPLSLHIMRLTSEYTGTLGTRSISGVTSMGDSDTESIVSSISDFEIGEGKKRKTFTKLLGGVARVKKGASRAARLISSEVNRRQRTREEKEEEKLGRLATDISTTDGVQVSSKDGVKAAAGFKRIQAHKSGPWDFENIQFGQDLSGHHSGPIWCMKFSLCGRLLATAGQDFILRIWVLRDKHAYFNNKRTRYQFEHEGISEEQVVNDEKTQDYLNSPDSQGHIFMDRPFVTYTGHTSDLLDISWSKNFFILTSSMDKTVRLWHISRKECLCVFQHIDFVTAIAFHPRNDQFFLSGSLDGKIRLWNIPDKKVTLWNEVDGATKLITAANFCQNGKFACVGTYDGRCIFYSTDQLKYHTTIHVRSSRGKNSVGRKVTGIEPMPGEDKILVTSTDSRIRLYDLRDLSLVCKYRGYTNLSSQIRACFSPDGRYVCAGSENHCVFLWSTHHVPNSLTARKDRNNYYEAIKAHNAAVTCTLFAPVPELIFEAVERGREAAGKTRTEDEAGEPGSMEGGPALTGYVVISGDYDGDIKVFIKEGKRSSLPRHDR